MKTCIGYGAYEGECGSAPDLKLNKAGLWCTRCELLRRETITAQMDHITSLFETGERTANVASGLLSSHHDTGGER
jgi:hypothetical protein